MNLCPPSLSAPLHPPSSPSVSPVFTVCHSSWILIQFSFVCFIHVVTEQSLPRTFVRFPHIRNKISFVDTFDRVSLRNLHHPFPTTFKDFLFVTPPHKQAGWECTGSWKTIHLGQLISVTKGIFYIQRHYIQPK